MPVFRLLVALLVLAASLAPARAQQPWPSQPVHLIVPFAAGGTTDMFARLLARHMQRTFNVPFVIENHGGAGGNIGAAMAAKAAPDGYTWLFVFDSHAVNPFLIPDLKFDTVKDLAPVTLVGTAPMAIATSPNKPYRSFDDVVKAAKAKPGSVNYGSI